MIRADLANLVNEAALLAWRQNKIVMEKIDFIHVLERSIAGTEKKTTKLQGSEKAVVARHEVGHAVVGTIVSKLLARQPRVNNVGPEIQKNNTSSRLLLVAGIVWLLMIRDVRMLGVGMSMGNMVKNLRRKMILERL